MSQTPQPPLGGRYELRRQLASTPAARVYLAQDLELGRPVAIKVLGPDLARDPQIVERFRQAANTAASVHDPSIVTIYDCGRGPGRGVRRDGVRRRREPGRHVARHAAGSGSHRPINMGVRVAEALDAAHRAGLVHGSLKPRDVLLGQDGTVKVTDFGTATAGLASLAGPVAVATYDSPEQLQGQAPDARSDLYALGIAPVRVDDGRAAVHRAGRGRDHAAQARRARRSLRRSPTPGIPPGFDAIVDRLLERDPARRYSDRW